MSEDNHLNVKHEPPRKNSSKGNKMSAKNLLNKFTGKSMEASDDKYHKRRMNSISVNDIKIVNETKPCSSPAELKLNEANKCDDSDTPSNNNNDSLSNCEEEMRLSPNPFKTNPDSNLNTPKSSNASSTTSLTGNALKIKYIVEELLSTEEAYLSRIELIDRVFRKAFLDKADPNEKSYPSAKTIQEVFSNIVSILTFHTEFFVPELRERIHNWTEDSQIADIFVKYGHQFKLYTIYINQYDASCIQITNICKKFSKFAHDMQEIEKKPECKDLKLVHHMLEPIQRIPRYKLLLTEILKKSTQGTPEYSVIEKALEIVSDSAQKANDRIADTKKAMKLLEIQNMFSDNINIVCVGRTFVKEGSLLRRQDKNMKYIPCHLLIFSDIIMICSKNSSNKLRKKITFDYSKIGLKRDYAEEKQQNCFALFDVDNKVILSSSTPEERASWIEAIEQTVKDHDQKLCSFLVKGHGASGTNNVNVVLSSKAIVLDNETNEWNVKYVSLTAEKKIIVSKSDRIDPSDEIYTLDNIECYQMDSIKPGKSAVGINFNESKKKLCFASKYDDMFFDRWYQILIKCNTRQRANTAAF